MPGHLFIVQGDLTQIACDAWLVPTDRFFTLTSAWWKALGLHDGASARSLVENPEWGSDRCLPCARDNGKPWPWLADVGGTALTAPEWYAEGVVQFLEHTAKALRETDKTLYLKERIRPLVALPVVGTGEGGQAASRGDVYRPLLTAVRGFLDRTDGDQIVDVVLVARGPTAFAAAQRAREDVFGEDMEPWPGLAAGPDEVERINEGLKALVESAREGRLVIFLGAGVSAGANLPRWGELLEKLLSAAGIEEKGQRADIMRLSLLDQAEYVSQRLQERRVDDSGDRGGILGEAVKEILEKHDRYSLAHALVASLPVSEMVTTNYDTLLEQACDAVGRSVAVLPHAPEAKMNRWLLKMHGCTSKPEDIVLARTSYLRYQGRWEALAGIVQAMLITRDMLFLGFGMEDDNFFRIVDAVRRALENGSHDPPDLGAPRLGYATSLSSKPIFEYLWEGDIQWLVLGDKQPEGATKREKAQGYKLAAWRFELLLDRLSAASCTASFVMDNRYGGLLSDEDKRFYDLFTKFLDARGDSAAWRRAVQLAQELGWEEPDSPGKGSHGSGQ